MATSFPSGLDSFTNPTAVDTLDSPPHDTQHADANDAIEALQSKVGVDGSAVTTSLDYKVGALESRPVETKTASYTLVATDVNKRIVMNNAGATTITVNDAVFAAGDTVWIHNIGAGTTTVTAGTATVDTAGSLDVGQWEGGSLYFTSASSAIFFRGGGAGVGTANFTDTATGTYTDGGKNYKYLTFTASGTLTVDVAGYADVLVLGGGGGGRTAHGGGSGAGAIETQIFLTAATHTVTVGAGGASGGGADGNASSIGSIIVVSGGKRGTLSGCDSGGMATSTEYPYNDSRSARYRTTSGAGGAGAVGNSSGGGGGAGYTTNIENSSRSNLGQGGSVTAPVTKSANTGQGGDASGGSSSAGGSGLIVVRVEV